MTLQHGDELADDDAFRKLEVPFGPEPSPSCVLIGAWTQCWIGLTCVLPDNPFKWTHRGRSSGAGQLRQDVNCRLWFSAICEVCQDHLPRPKEFQSAAGAH